MSTQKIKQEAWQEAISMHIQELVLNRKDPLNLFCVVSEYEIRLAKKQRELEMEKSLHKVVAYDNHDMSQDIGLFETRDEAERLVADLAVHMTRSPEPADAELIRKWENDSPIHKISPNNYFATAYFLRFVIERVKIDSYPVD